MMVAQSRQKTWSQGYRSTRKQTSSASKRNVNRFKLPTPEVHQRYTAPNLFLGQTSVCYGPLGAKKRVMAAEQHNARSQGHCGAFFSRRCETDGGNCAMLLCKCFCCVMRRLCAGKSEPIRMQHGKCAKELVPETKPWQLVCGMNVAEDL